MSEDFVSDFIEECVNKNIFDAKQICEEAIKQIKVNEDELIKADQIRIKIYNLRKVLKQFNHETVRKIRSNRLRDVSKAYINTSELDLIKNYAINICNYIEKNGPSSPHQIRDAIGSYEDHVKIYGAMKWLGEKNIITRDSSGLKFLKGNNWDIRPNNIHSEMPD